MEDLGSMFDDLSFDTLASTPTAAVAKEPSREKKASLPQMTTLRGVSASFDLDALISDEEKRRHKWKNMFKVGETGIEALYTEDGQYYAARIDEVLEQPQMYQLTFTDYGNSQVTEESNIRYSLARKLELSSAAATAEAAKSKRPVAGRSSHGHIQMPDATRPSDHAIVERRRVSENSSTSMSAAFAAMLVDGPPPPSSSASVTKHDATDYSSMAVLPPLPAEEPPITQQLAYKEYKKLRFEYERRGLPVEAPAPAAEAKHKRTFSLGKSSGNDTIQQPQKTGSKGAASSRFSGFKKK